MGLLLCFQWGSGGHAADLYHLPGACRASDSWAPGSTPLAPPLGASCPGSLLLVKEAPP